VDTGFIYVWCGSYKTLICVYIKQESCLSYSPLHLQHLEHAKGNQYCENGHTTESISHSQCNSYQNSNDMLHRDRKINSKVHLEAQNTLNSQSNLEQNRAKLEVLQYLTSNYTTEL
jgi:hypothetical protein